MPRPQAQANSMPLARLRIACIRRGSHPRWRRVSSFQARGPATLVICCRTSATSVIHDHGHSRRDGVTLVSSLVHTSVATSRSNMNGADIPFQQPAHGHRQLRGLRGRGPASALSRARPSVRDTGGGRPGRTADAPAPGLQSKTGAPTPPWRTSTTSSGIAFIAKPFTAEGLRRNLREVLDA